MPFQFPGLAVQRENAIRVKIVAEAIIAVVLFRRIPCRPIHDVQYRIIGSDEPGGRAAVVDVLALPGFRTRLAALGDSPESPHFFSGRLIERNDESVGPVLAPGDAAQHQPVRQRQRCRRCEIVQPRIRDFGLPQQLSIKAIERDDVRILCVHEDATARHSRAAIEPGDPVPRALII